MPCALRAQAKRNGKFYTVDFASLGPSSDKERFDAGICPYYTGSVGHGMGDKPRIRSQRVTFSMIVGWICSGRSICDLRAEYPYLDRDDILEVRRYAAWCAGERGVDL